jgi:hypothetical protein
MFRLFLIILTLKKITMNSISTQDILAKINKATQTDFFNVIEINQINEGTISFIDKEGISDLFNGDINVILQFQTLKKFTQPALNPWRINL